MKRALYAYKITGIKTSIKFLGRIMDTPDFVNGKYNTHFIEDNEEFLMTNEGCDGDCKAIATIVAYIDYQNRLKEAKLKLNRGTSINQNNWKSCGRKKAMLRL